ncbi:hypothetical protein ASF84_05215 [Pseudomonas sp. Leaf127]|uniref:hypothetical protein n=1 Tax=Pseudomonas sp. Leaf127 TaxID=1736267 RepID=UPI000702D1C1|nr:hypothetical protein [Pseudomonas sp. Leaf127]KQQ60112.1 hypothetical protein ASF84_05215 [Pseudomonas sp. Leaf127]
MSPHILLDKALEALGDYGCPDPIGQDVLELITTFFLDEVISRDEFNHYCERHLKAIRQRPVRRVA